MSKVKQDLTSFQHQLYLEGKKQSGPIPHLMSWLVDRRNLAGAWHHVKVSPGADSPGPDGMTPRQVKNPERLLSELAEQIIKGQFVPSAVRQIHVPKGPNKTGTRTLSLLNLRDRIVHTAIKQVLEPLIEPTFLSVSYGFRPGRSVAGALGAVVHALSEAGSALAYGTSLDIAACFDHLDVDILMSRLKDYVQDEDFLNQVERILAAGSQRTGIWHPRRVGVLQGSPLSPLLCNLYLHSVDQTIVRYQATRPYRGRYFRYADDILFLAESRASLMTSVRQLNHSLRACGLHLRSAPRPSSVIAEGVSWLGVRIRPRCALPQGRVVFGYCVPDLKIAEILAAVEEMTELPDKRLEAGTFALSGWIRSLNRQLQQWRQAYMYADNAYAVFQVVDDFVRDRVRRLIRHLLKLSSREVQAQFMRRLPYGHWTFEVEGTQLVTLSAMPPQRPGILVYKPAWLSPRSSSIDKDASDVLINT